MKKPAFSPETFKMMFMLAGLLGILVYCREGGFTKMEGVGFAAICAAIWFYLGRLSVPSRRRDSDDGESE